MDDAEFREFQEDLQLHPYCDRRLAAEAIIARIPQLLEAEAILHALYAAGVDNWEGYAFALDEVE